ncbi:MAG: (2Fe-2S)-binding protein [Candidatus Zixiibacteriota bacterium]
MNYAEFIVNGQKVDLLFNPDDSLMTMLRENGYVDVKNGCGAGTCGACAVLLDGRLIFSCQALAGSAIGKSITTVRGIGTIHKPHPIQEAFVEAGAVQCGFCIPGKVLATYVLLNEIPNPTDQQIKEALHGHLCRCTGYAKILDAVHLAAKKMAQKGGE